MEGFTSLKELNLAGNQLSSDLHIEGLLTMSRLTNLDLSDNKIHSFVTHQGSKSLSRLDVLTLDGNMIDGDILRESLQALSSSIRKLSMCNNIFKGTIVAGDLYNLRNLEYLRLDGSSNVKNEFFKSIGNLTSLKVLSLANCHINDTLPTTDWFKLKNLEELDLSQNLFVGPLPLSFLNMTSIQKLELSRNQFSGKFDSNIATLTSLEYFGFTENQFEVLVSFRPFFNLSNLKFIYGERNKVILDLRPSMQTWIPKFQLQVLSLPSMIATHSLPLPRFLLHQNNLTSLDFSNYWFEGGFPHWLLENNTKLTEALLRNCSLSGTMQLPLRSLSGLQRLDVSDNTIIGEIPSKNMSVVYPNLVYVNMSRNHIQGSIPRELGQMKLLRELDLSYNQLSGEIPEDMFKKDMNPYIRNQLSYQLYVLILSNNKFEGPVFTIPTDLEYLSLNDNNFSGELPSNIFDISIISLDVSNNHLVGKIPSFGNTMTNLLELRMSNNSFEGFIPLELAQQPYLLYLDLSQNHLTGIVPSFLNSSLKFIHLSNNHFIGVSKKMFNGSSPVVMLDLNYNEISDNIQDMIQDLSYSKLNFLFLKGNHITGDIPKELCQMKYLTMLDLSHNKFSGEIPPCFGIMPFDNNNLDSSLKLLKGSFFIEERVTEATSRRTAVPRAPVSTKQQKVTASFTSKRNIYIYMGSTLTYMSGIDLSQNKLKGNIPFDIGNLTRIQALNLSHNDLTGQIPDSFSNLVHTESLDLSFNKLSGQIPPKLNNLTFLQVLSVAHNNLSGPIPEGAQFNTFTSTSYEDNPFLCGPPLAKSCHQTPTIIRHKPNYEERSIDMYFFRVSFVVSYTLALLATAAVLYINSYWRQVWFYYMELVSSNCYYFIVDNFCRFCNARNI
ncbi:receptor-like protein 13 [Vigna umbellata]|uniref:receptor-like protein 13 n=1 Tax=Vigna umbellata TaxID=87088 RepID=UPI001F5F4EFA|nr:receptor-like protein 13 [Vigna umbellata]XP_047171917.1 receptor-like protein 13 [Vigna umbellata]